MHTQHIAVSLYIRLHVHNNMVIQWVCPQLDTLQVFQFLHFWIEAIFFNQLHLILHHLWPSIP